ncbi:MAG: hypothetical protein QM775_33665 [Pirellulales bacterium]
MSDILSTFMTDGDLLMYAGLSMLGLLAIVAAWQGRTRRPTTERR